jgi:hypothetical protein
VPQWSTEDPHQYHSLYLVSKSISVQMGTYLQQFPNPLPAHVVELPHNPFCETVKVLEGRGGKIVVLVELVEVETVVDGVEVGVGVGERVGVVVGSTG